MGYSQEQRSRTMTHKIQDYWKDTRLNYDNVVLSNLVMQSNYMADVSQHNADVLEDFQDTEQFHYWAAFSDILQTFNEGCCTGYTVPKNLERARMAGMIDAMNTIIEMMKKGEFME
jgi:hypothetical protein